MSTPYKPRPIDTSHITLPSEIMGLQEKLAENTHEVSVPINASPTAGLTAANATTLPKNTRA